MIDDIEMLFRVLKLVWDETDVVLKPSGSVEPSRISLFSSCSAAPLRSLRELARVGQGRTPIHGSGPSLHPPTNFPFTNTAGTDLCLCVALISALTASPSSQSS